MPAYAASLSKNTSVFIFIIFSYHEDGGRRFLSDRGRRRIKLHVVTYNNTVILTVLKLLLFVILLD